MEFTAQSTYIMSIHNGVNDLFYWIAKSAASGFLTLKYVGDHRISTEMEFELVKNGFTYNKSIHTDHVTGRNMECLDVFWGHLVPHEKSFYSYIDSNTLIKNTTIEC